VKLERIQDLLLSLSNQILDSVGSGYADYRLMHVPVSSALMTVYSEEFFGIGQTEGNAVASKDAGDIDA
jgi:hypothetical protein